MHKCLFIRIRFQTPDTLQLHKIFDNTIKVLFFTTVPNAPAYLGYLHKVSSTYSFYVNCFCYKLILRRRKHSESQITMACVGSTVVAYRSK